MKKIIWLLIWLVPVAVFPQEWTVERKISGKIVKVTDGDSFTLLNNDNQQIKIRLYGVDCPEYGQDFSKRAQEKAAELIAGKTVDVYVYDTDQYKRKVGDVVVDNKSVAEELLKAGLAWNYPQYNTLFPSTYKMLEDEARSLKKGLWVQKAVAPWEYRHGEDQTATYTPETSKPKKQSFTHNPDAASTKATKKKPTKTKSSAAAKPAGKSVAQKPAATKGSGSSTKNPSDNRYTAAKNESYVIICLSKSAHAYHSHYCRGLSRCRSGTETVSLSTAKKKGYRACGYCY